MYIERVQIEEGFLDGLDVSLSPGLNAVIGARGTGKTSLIELIKFCLDVRGYTSETSKRSLDHALSVLGGGQVTVTISDANQKIVISRTASDTAPRASGPFRPPLVFSQTEIETVGLQARGRLGLISSFVQGAADTVAEAEASSEIRSLTAESATLRRDIDELRRRLADMPTIDAELLKLAPSEQQLSKLSVDASNKKAELDALSADIALRSVATTIIERYRQAVSRWQGLIEVAVKSIPLSEPWPDGNGEDPLAGVRTRIGIAENSIRKALQELGLAELDITGLATSATTSRIVVEEKSRQLRKELDSLQSGAGAIVRQGQQLRERKAQLQALVALAEQRQKDLELLLKRRATALDKLDEIRDRRFAARAEATKLLNGVLSPRIRIVVSRAGQFEAFAAAIADSLKGSGIKYGDLAPALAAKMSPRELLEAAELDDVSFVAQTAGISPDRATRVLSQLRDADLGSIGTVAVEDSVDFQLLDGSDYKDIGELSTGQRCTVILPIVLRHTDRMLIVDQPEDHIDNAFIADTLILSILARDPQSQIIFSTHNANIPVLGDANHVLHMGSDGKRGFALTGANLDTPEVVSAITSVMEGGLQAFDKRSAFYKRHKAK